MKVLLLLVLMASTAAAQSPAPTPVTGEVTFRVLLRGRDIGMATASLVRTEGGWSIRGASRLDAPVNLNVKRIEVNYTDVWMPHDATLDMATPDEGVVVHAAFPGQGDAKIDIVRDGRQVVFVTAAVAADAMILPSLAFSAYEALAFRLGSELPGRTLKAYVLPQREMAIRLDRVTDETFRTRGRAIRTKRWRITFLDPAGAVSADVWVDGRRLARLDIPRQELSVIREDLVR